MNKKRVLIFPAGSEISFEIVNALKYSKFVELVGGTSAEDHSEFVFKELIHGFPYVNDEGFLGFLNEKISEHRIDCVYPAHDSVSVFLSEHADEISAMCIITDEFTTKTCRSKKATYEYFAGEEFIPRMYSSADEVEAFPVFVKPETGQGSQGAKKISSKEELVNALNEDPSRIICEYLPGMEYTVDCFTDAEGVLRAAKLRDRERIRTGISVRSRSLGDDPKVQEIASRINSRLNFKGAWFFQLRRNIDGKYMLMEISPRIPGTMGVSRNAGINFPLLTLYVFCVGGGGGLH
ncbi:MAG: ATP-grasp domain-containing protein [Synergistaceae bacterium]|nr:ATP-grasp domain-containing protein [Synergistaceae bacterium]